MKGKILSWAIAITLIFGTFSSASVLSFALDATCGDWIEYGDPKAWSEDRETESDLFLISMPEQLASYTKWKFYTDGVEPYMWTLRSEYDEGSIARSGQDYLNEVGGDKPCIIDGCDTPISEGGFSECVTKGGITYYCVDNCKQLSHIREHFEKQHGYSSCNLNFIQTDNIDLSECSDGDWTPIGGFRGNGIFLGTYLGGGYKIENMSLNKNSLEEDIVSGLFSRAGTTAHFEGINLYVNTVDLSLSADDDTAEQGKKSDETPKDILFGGIVGLHQSLMTVVDCSVTFMHEINTYNELGDIYVGGITAANEGSVLNCKTYSNLDFTGEEDGPEPYSIQVEADGAAYIGGIAGLNTGNIRHSDHEGVLFATTTGESSKKVTETNTNGIYIGGIAGYADASIYSNTVEIENCQNNGYIVGLNSNGYLYGARSCAGGIAGYIYEGEEKSSTDDVLVKGSTGKPYVSIRNCANIGEDTVVYARAQSALSGGIVGASRLKPGAFSVIQNCYNRSDIYSDIYYYDKTKAGSKVPCVGAASGGIIGASGGIGIITSYSSADSILTKLISGKASEPDDPMLAGGIAGLVWDVSFDQNYYLKDKAVKRGIGGSIAPALESEPESDTKSLESMLFEIEIIGDPENVTSASAVNLKTKSFFGDKWEWYAGGGEPDQFYDSVKPWRYTSAKSYPVLRGEINRLEPVISATPSSQTATIKSLEVILDFDPGSEELTVAEARYKITGSAAEPEYNSEDGRWIVYNSASPIKLETKGVYYVHAYAMSSNGVSAQKSFGPYNIGTSSSSSGTGGGSGSVSATTSSCTVIFKANDGSDKTIAEKETSLNGTVTLPEEPVRSGYTFTGWNKKMYGEGYTFTAMTQVKESITVYAQWEKNGNMSVASISRYFTDMSEANWAIHDIDFLYERDVVHGVGENLFRPNVEITRADFITMLIRAYGLNVEYSGNFEDVKEGTYYYNAVGIAKELGIAKGDGVLFRPNDPITRQDAITLAQRTLDTIGLSLEPGTETDLARFVDAGDVASYARVPVSTFIKAKVAVGEGNHILPLDHTTRAEMAVILYRMLNLQ